MEQNRIYVMDCVRGMRERVKDETVDVVVTSPPYNIGIGYSTYRDNISKSDYLDWLEEVIRELRRVLKEDGSFFLNVGGKPSDPLWPLKIALRSSEVFTLQNTIHWIKSIAVSKDDMGNYPHVLRDFSAGHYKPVNSRAYLNGCHEYIFHFTKNGCVSLDKTAVGVEYQDKSNQRRWSSARELRDRGNTWFIPYQTIRTSRSHPSTFPSRLPEMCLKLHGLDKARLCLDPFMGIGNTALACTNLGVDYIGFELDQVYAETAEERVIQQKFNHSAGPGPEAVNSAETKRNFKLALEQLSPVIMEPLFSAAEGSEPDYGFIRKLQRLYSPREKLLLLERKDIQKLKRLTGPDANRQIRNLLLPILERLREVEQELSNHI